MPSLAENAELPCADFTAISAGNAYICRYDNDEQFSVDVRNKDMKNVFKAIKQQRAHNRACHELNSLSDRELADLGIFRADIPSVVAGNRHLD